MAKLKTQPTHNSVEEFLASVTSDQKRLDCMVLAEIMKEITGNQPVLWGSGIVGFGQYHYRYDSGREGDWFLTGFSPRKRNLSIYIPSGFDKYPQLMEKLGRFKMGVGCLYVSKLDNIDRSALKALITNSCDDLRKKYS